MNYPSFSVDYCASLLSNWLSSLAEVWHFLNEQSFNNTLDDLIHILEWNPIFEPLNILLIPISNLIESTGIGNFTMLEVTLLYGFGGYVFFVFLRWVWNSFPIL